MSNYRNKLTKVDGINFDSEREALRYCELKLLQRAKQIHDLKVHVIFHLMIGHIAITEYEADFEYIDIRNGKRIVEDVKPKYRNEKARKAYQKTLAYRMFAIKKRMMSAIYGIEVAEV